ncbi:phosphoribosylaminoimidazolecarboxamide formyltransferase [Neobacillus niacini]|uniref:phosphoribosylaminoimidazolecarboxamide formyltransferase n=1 Tax=Neobacillus niacini TaxID=86668 RepID=UPI002862D58E|nr:phosphoribosylaminoimidazolecarboxamide formyltransferase [Neobacillus niacini]MDR7002925.1 phosphoribosylaminoimidazolecarboxamide formyltransferase/IMP cyclohydrolase [Neobacillus niacini]
MEEIVMRYGINPNQGNAKVKSLEKLPFKILNGEPSYINLLDAFNSYQLVRELKFAIGEPAAASFKHVSPSGAAVYNPLNNELAKSYFVDDMELSPLAIAYARARGTDRMSSFGDCAALSDKVDLSVAKFLKREVSDMVVAPAFDDDALEILKSKKKGKYLIIEIDPDYEPEPIEERTLFGVSLVQDRNNMLITEKILNNIVTENKFFPDSAKRDLLISAITLKYTQSNSVCFAKDGQTIGVGAGQQSRIHCTRLAALKAENWYLRQHPIALSMKFREEVSHTAKNNAIDKWLCDDLTAPEKKAWEECFNEVPHKLTHNEKREYLNGLKEVSFASDAFLPFRDNIDRVAQSGAKYILQTGGSLRDKEVIDAANEYGIVMAFSGVRLFHH